MSTFSPSQYKVLNLLNISLLVDKKNFKIQIFLILSLLCLSFLALFCGDSILPFHDIYNYFFNPSEAVPGFILWDIRLPRIVAAIVGGIALGMSGSLIQTLFLNRLATPDILGINEGAALTITVTVLFLATALWPFWIAPIGSLIAVTALMFIVGKPSKKGNTLLIVGVCLSGLLEAIIEFLMSTGTLHDIQGIYIWLQGSFVGQGYSVSLSVLACIIVLLPIVFYFSRYLKILCLSPENQQGLGLNQKILLFIGIVLAALLAALGTSIGGPVVFVALASPVLISFLTKGFATSPFTCGLMGGLLLLISDTIARTVIAPNEIAAGIITRILGGIFLYLYVIKRSKGSRYA